MSRHQKPQDGWEPMEYAPTEEQITAMAKAWKLWDAEREAFRRLESQQ